jgi:hypothetical protein
MITRPRAHLLVPLLALSITFAVAASAQEQDRQYRRSSDTSASLRIDFGTQPRWEGVRGTQVRTIRQGDRTDYDMFRYGRNYYVYNNYNHRWYMSRRWRGQFTLISDRSVPRDLRRVPRNRWRNYPTAWEDRGYQGPGGNSFMVSFGTRPRWSGISGTRVERIYGAERPGYDVFRYGGSYYAYNDNRWYMSANESGQFALIDDRSVPSEFSRVSRENWRHYPSQWDNRDYRSSGGSSATLRVSFGSTPRWSGISGTRVEAVYGADRPDFDVFRYGGSYYAYNNGGWYTSNRESGDFRGIDSQSVPSELSRVPRERWRNYPAEWDGEDWYDSNGRRSSGDRNDQYDGDRGGY